MQNNGSIMTWATAIIVSLLTLILIAQCSRHDKMIGRYQSVADSPDDRVPVTLELQANGRGLWSIDTDNAPFRWNLHQNRIRLHTRSGGVIEGIVHNTTIQIALPGMGDIWFERIK